MSKTSRVVARTAAAVAALLGLAAQPAITAAELPLTKDGQPASAIVISPAAPETRFSEIILAREGRTDFVIVEAAEPTPAEQTAATELATYLGRMTAAEFPIIRESGGPPPAKAVHDGWTAFAAAQGIAAEKLGDEEWLVRSAAENLIVTGGRPRGTLCAAWELLDHRGCVWAARHAELIPE